MFPAVDTTAALSYLLDQVYLNPPTVVREESSDLGTFPSYFSGVAGDIRVTATSDGVRINSVTLVPSVDAWTLETLKSIAAHRNLSDGWDGRAAPHPTTEALDTADLLAQAFSYAPTSKRPSFSVDTEGNPSFSSYNNDLYLHLTVDRPGVISWYSVRDGKEIFHDNVEIDGFNLEELASEILMLG